MSNELPAFAVCGSGRYGEASRSSLCNTRERRLALYRRA